MHACLMVDGGERLNPIALVNFKVLFDLAKQIYFLDSERQSVICLSKQKIFNYYKEIYPFSIL